MAQQLTREDVERYLRTCLTEEPSADFGSLLHLTMAGIDSLREHVAEGDILQHAHLITDEQARFLAELLEGRAESTAWFVHDVSHSSQTGLL